MATGMSPVGPVDGFRYGSALYQDCGGGDPGLYEVSLSTDGRPSNCTDVQTLTLGFPFPKAGTQSAGTFAASASLATFPNEPITTNNVTLEATRIDPPFDAAARVTGRFRADADGWSFDVVVDVTSIGAQVVCDI